MHALRNISPTTHVKVAIAHINIATATALVHKEGNPFLVLVGDSKKHKGPVLIGGKIDKADCQSEASLKEGALVCIKRELCEEAGIQNSEPKFLFQTSDLTRDIRKVSASRLHECVGVQTAPSDVEVLAHYGVPDFVFLLSIKADEFQDSEELKNLRFIDIRQFDLTQLGAGLGATVERYRTLMRRGEVRARIK